MSMQLSEQNVLFSSWLLPHLNEQLELYLNWIFSQQ